MNTHDIVVIGGSAGSIPPFKQILQGLGPSYRGAVFFVRHLNAEVPDPLSLLRTVHTPLPLRIAGDRDSIEAGTVYIARPGCHLLVQKGHMRLGYGPIEHRWRPAIDPLFRSAAASYGPRVIGVILSGYLDDGVSGLAAVKKCGGVTVVQDPGEAEAGDMPGIALESISPDYCAPAAEIASILSRLATQPVEGRAPAPGRIAKEVETAMSRHRHSRPRAINGESPDQSCPACGGPLMLTRQPGVAPYRCHIGHAYAEKTLLSHQKDILDTAMISAARMLEERRNFLLMMQRDKRAGWQLSSQSYEQELARVSRALGLLEQGLEVFDSPVGGSSLPQDRNVDPETRMASLHDRGDLDSQGFPD